MKKKKVGTNKSRTKSVHGKEEKTYKRPNWVQSGEEELCPDCYKVVGDRSRYKLVCTLGKEPEGMRVADLTDVMKLKQPTVTHHLTILRSVDAVRVLTRGRERIYTLNRDAHCFEDCKIPY